MAEQTKIEKTEDYGDWEPGELTGDLYNLACTFSYLSEIDSQLLSKDRQSKLARMKRLIFDAMVYHCDELPDLHDSNNEE